MGFFIEHQAAKKAESEDVIENSRSKGVLSLHEVSLLEMNTDNLIILTLVTK